MKRVFIYLSLFFIVLSLSSWGFFAHIHINRLAVFTLPQGPLRFFKANINYLSAHAVDPDKRRYADTSEAPRHYLDVDLYEIHPDSIPRKYDLALKKYGYKKLQENGILPWQIQRNYAMLVQAFKLKDSSRILTLATSLGHYIADAHVPLHTTSNHNGQLTNQHGLHAFWESRLPELYAEEYNLMVGSARYVENPLNEAWKIVTHSHGLVDSVLRLEANLHSSFPTSRKYSYSKRNQVLVKQYAEAYAKAYHLAMNKMVERQMRASIRAIGAFWYSAWIDAGQPELQHFKNTGETKSEWQQRKAGELKFKQGKIIGREP
ncbi:zinc dependent phospholipase C family protein [Pedobacter sp.]|uniref:zinc dependent phospholipase C family protein n=1 Tax=Pedobacter sp. TaxID=1411316 RepID=UPI003D7FF891